MLFCMREVMRLTQINPLEPSGELVDVIVITLRHWLASFYILQHFDHFPLFGHRN